jgi:hypothetical protein
MALYFKSLLLGALTTAVGTIIYSIMFVRAIRKNSPFHGPGLSLAISASVLWEIIVFFLLASVVSFLILRAR